MQLSHLFSTLLAGFLLGLSTTNEVAAAPAPRARSVTLPLHRIEQARSGVHPQILLQQKMNRAHKRLAKMSGRQAPSNKDLFDQLHKRVHQVEGSAGIRARREAYNAWTGTHNGTIDKSGKSKRLNRRTGERDRQFDNGSLSKRHHKHKDPIGGPDSNVGVAIANPPSAANSLGLDIEGADESYMATILIGTPPTPFLILMDSGSADFWVAGEQCQSQAGGDCGQHRTLGSTFSSTFIASSNAFQVTYGSGAVAGSIIQDDIVIAGLPLTKHTFGVAIEETVDFSDDSVPFDGLMGLAKSMLSNQQTLTPVEALANHSLIPAAITSYKISRSADNKKDGEITFGVLDPTKFDASTLVEFPNVNTQGFWEGAVDATVNGQDSGLSGRTAILDTGTTVIYMPQGDAAAIHALIQGAQDVGGGQFVLPCNTTDSVAFTFNGGTFRIHRRDIAVQPISDGSPFCNSGITGGSLTSGKQWLVGDVFLKNAYFSTNADTNTIILAKLV